MQNNPVVLVLTWSQTHQVRPNYIVCYKKWYPVIVFAAHVQLFRIFTYLASRQSLSVWTMYWSHHHSNVRSHSSHSWQQTMLSIHILRSLIIWDSIIISSVFPSGLMIIIIALIYYTLREFISLPLTSCFLCFRFRCVIIYWCPLPPKFSPLECPFQKL